MIAAGIYSVRGVKSFEGREGLGFNATLCAGPRKLASVIDSANGGCLRFRWLAATPEQRAADEEALNAHCAGLPAWRPADAGVTGAPEEAYPMDADLFVTELVGDYEERSRLRRLLKRRVVFRVGTGSLQQLAASFKPSPAVFAQVQKAWPDAVIVNLMPVELAVDLLLATSQVSP